jgi:hypothetical protein
MAGAKTEREFYEIPRDRRFFFSWKEARDTDHYEAILAWPVHGGPPNAPRVIGVVSVDIGDQAPGDKAVEKLGSSWKARRADFDAHLAVCAAVLRKG